MILVIGEILFDVFPGFRRIGGAPFNFAFHLKKMGVPVRFVSRVGQDAAGEEILAFLKQHGFDLEDIQTDADHPTGSVQVTLDSDGTPHFKIQQKVAYDYIRLDPRIQTFSGTPPALFYFGTLIQRTPGGHESVQRILSSRPAGMKTFYDVNLRPECYSDAVVLSSLAHTDFLKLNLEEWRQLESMLGLRKDDAAFARDLMESHAVEVVLRTQGAEGSQWFSRHGRYHQRPRASENAVDTVGAGDAFAAVAAVGYMKHWAPEKTLSLAQQLAERICAVRGALPESDAVYTPLRKELHG